MLTDGRCAVRIAALGVWSFATRVTPLLIERVASQQLACASASATSGHYMRLRGARLNRANLRSGYATGMGKIRGMQGAR